MGKLEDLKLIADWMGIENFVTIDTNILVRTDQYDLRGECVTYRPDSDWGQLMEVVEKIEGNWTFISIFGRCCTIELIVNGVNVDALIEQGKTKIEAVYKAVLEYIKQQSQKG